MDSSQDKYPFDIFVRNYTDDSPVCTITFGIKAGPSDEQQDDQIQDDIQDLVDDQSFDENFQKMHARVNNQTGWTLLDLKQMIH